MSSRQAHIEYGNESESLVDEKEVNRMAKVTRQSESKEKALVNRFNALQNEREESEKRAKELALKLKELEVSNT